MIDGKIYKKDSKIKFKITELKKYQNNDHWIDFGICIKSTLIKNKYWFHSNLFIYILLTLFNRLEINKSRILSYLILIIL